MKKQDIKVERPDEHGVIIYISEDEALRISTLEDKECYVLDRLKRRMRENKKTGEIEEVWEGKREYPSTLEHTLKLLHQKIQHTQITETSLIEDYLETLEDTREVLVKIQEDIRRILKG